MKISASKKQLAKIISENGGWREGAEFAAQDGDGTGSIDFFKSKPRHDKDDKFWRGHYDLDDRIESADVTIKNWHQTIVSRDEYFHLYPAPDADHSEDSLDMVEPNPAPTIEQLASDYKAKMEIAQKAREEADAANREADAALCKLEHAGEAIGLLVSPIKDDIKMDGEPSLNITDWRRLHAGDVIWLDHGVTRPSGEYEIKEIEKHEETCRAAVMWNHVPWWADLDKIDWHFIRRP